jgi:hypothetical protein
MIQELGRLGSVAFCGPLADVASGLLVVGLLRYPVTIDDHAAARDWITGTIAAISPGRRTKGVFALHPYQPSARRVYQGAQSATRGAVQARYALPSRQGARWLDRHGRTRYPFWLR